MTVIIDAMLCFGEMRLYLDAICRLIDAPSVERNKIGISNPNLSLEYFALPGLTA